MRWVVSLNHVDVLRHNCVEIVYGVLDVNAAQLVTS